MCSWPFDVICRIFSQLDDRTFFSALRTCREVRATLEFEKRQRTQAIYDRTIGAFCRKFPPCELEAECAPPNDGVVGQYIVCAGDLYGAFSLSQSVTLNIGPDCAFLDMRFPLFDRIQHADLVVGGQVILTFYPCGGATTFLYPSHIPFPCPTFHEVRLYLGWLPGEFAKLKADEPVFTTTVVRCTMDPGTRYTVHCASETLIPNCSTELSLLVPRYQSLVQIQLWFAAHRVQWPCTVLEVAFEGESSNSNQVHFTKAAIDLRANTPRGAASLTLDLGSGVNSRMYGQFAVCSHQPANVRRCTMALFRYSEVAIFLDGLGGKSTG